MLKTSVLAESLPENYSPLLAREEIHALINKQKFSTYERLIFAFGWGDSLLGEDFWTEVFRKYKDY